MEKHFITNTFIENNHKRNLSLWRITFKVRIQTKLDFIGKDGATAWEWCMKWDGWGKAFFYHNGSVNEVCSYGKQAGKGSEKERDGVQT